MRLFKMWAVLDSIVNPPDVYVFYDKQEAYDFLSWLSDVYIDDLDSLEGDERYAIVAVSIPPEHWNKNL